MQHCTVCQPCDYTVILAKDDTPTRPEVVLIKKRDPGEDKAPPLMYS
jgi:hypothetical protein